MTEWHLLTVTNSHQEMRPIRCCHWLELLFLCNCINWKWLQWQLLPCEALPPLVSGSANQTSVNQGKETVYTILLSQYLVPLNIAIHSNQAGNCCVEKQRPSDIWWRLLWSAYHLIVVHMWIPGSAYKHSAPVAMEISIFETLPFPALSLTMLHVGSIPPGWDEVWL